MAQARRAHDWQQTSAVLAMLANCHRDPKQRPEPFTPADFDPTAPKPEPLDGDITMLKIFVKGNK